MTALYNINFDTDFHEERDAIISRLIPQLREETKSKYGLELHVSVQNCVVKMSPVRAVSLYVYLENH